MRIALMVLRKLYLVPWAFFRLWWTSTHYDGDYRKGFERAKVFADNGIKAGNIKVEVHGVENVPK